MVAMYPLEILNKVVVVMLFNVKYRIVHPPIFDQILKVKTKK